MRARSISVIAAVVLAAACDATGNPIIGLGTSGGGASRLAFTVQPSNATAGVTISPAVAVVAQNASGSADTNFANSVSIAIGTNPGGGTLSGTTTVTATGGVATFNNLNINNAGNGYTLKASATLLTSATSATFNITP